MVGEVRGATTATESTTAPGDGGAVNEFIRAVHVVPGRETWRGCRGRRGAPFSQGDLSGAAGVDGEPATTASSGSV